MKKISNVKHFCSCNTQSQTRPTVISQWEIYHIVHEMGKDLTINSAVSLAEGEETKQWKQHERDTKKVSPIDCIKKIWTNPLHFFYRVISKPLFPWTAGHHVANCAVPEANWNTPTSIQLQLAILAWLTFLLSTQYDNYDNCTFNFCQICPNIFISIVTTKTTAARMKRGLAELCWDLPVNQAALARWEVLQSGKPTAVSPQVAGWLTASPSKFLVAGVLKWSAVVPGSFS